MKQDEIRLDSATLHGAAQQVAKNWWAVLCMALALLLGMTGIGKLTYSPEYTASATLVIRVKGADAYSSLAQTKQMTTVYSEVFQSEALRNVIQQDLGEEVVGTITCSQISETNLLVLRAVAPTPRQAYLYIHAALQSYEEVAGYVFTGATLELVQEPQVPEKPSNTSVFIRYRLWGAAFGAAGIAALIVLLYFLRNTLKAANQASSLLEGKVLGTVPYEKKQTKVDKTGKKSRPALVLSSPLVSMNFAEASRRAATRLEAHLHKKQYKVLMVASVEENEGKSTVAANIAIALAEHGQRVLLVDGDFRKPAQYRIFEKGTKNQASFSDVVSGKVAWQDAVRKNERCGIWELFQYKALKNPGALLNSPRLTELLHELRNEMDYIVVDCSPVAAAADAELWMHCVDTAVLVVRQDLADIRIINDTVDVIWKSAGDFSGFVLNAFQDKPHYQKASGRYGDY